MELAKWLFVTGTVVVHNSLLLYNFTDCLLPKKVGPCEAAIPRYYYDSKTNKCEFFYYGGCEGNANNFETKRECEATCKRGTLSR